LVERGTEIFQWFFHTRTVCSMHGQEGGSAGDIDDEFAHRAMDNFDAFILGRNMFSPVRGPWLDDSWKGWWESQFRAGRSRFGGCPTRDLIDSLLGGWMRRRHIGQKPLYRQLETLG